MNNGHLTPPLPPAICFAVTARAFQFDIYINNNENILALKTKIQESIAVEVERQTLIHGDLELEDDRTIESYGFGVWPATVPITLTAAPAEIVEENFLIDLNEHSYWVTEMSTVGGLKSGISVTGGIPEGTFDLYRFDQRMEDHHTLYDYHVGPWTRIEIRPI